MRVSEAQMALSMGVVWKIKMRKELQGKRKRRSIENRLTEKRAQ